MARLSSVLSAAGSRFLAAALLCCTSQTWAANELLLGQASVSVTGLRYHLVDLDLNDGITPSIQFAGGGNNVGLYGVLQLQDDVGEGLHVQTRQFLGNPFLPTSPTASSTWDDVEIGQGPETISVDHTFGLDDDAIQRFRHGPVQWYRDVGLISEVESAAVVLREQSGPGYWQDLTFSLSANTALFIEATVELSTAFDIDALLANATLASAFGNKFDSLRASSDAQAIFHIGGSSGFPAYVIRQAQIYEVNQQQQVQYTQTGDTAPGNVLLRFDNTSSSAVSSSLTIQLDTRQGVVATVPEPATWGLIAGGMLMVVGYQARRRRTG